MTKLIRLNYNFSHRKGQLLRMCSEHYNFAIMKDSSHKIKFQYVQSPCLLPQISHTHMRHQDNLGGNLKPLAVCNNL